MRRLRIDGWLFSFWMWWRVVRRKKIEIGADHGFEFGERGLVISQVHARFGFHVAEVALDCDPLGESCFARFIGELSRLEGLPHLRHEFVAEQLDVMMRGRDLLQ